MGIDYILGMKGNNVLSGLSASVQMDACLIDLCLLLLRACYHHIMLML